MFILWIMKGSIGLLMEGRVSGLLLVFWLRGL